MFKDKEAEEKLEKYRNQLSKLKNKYKQLRKKNEKLKNQKRKILEEKKNILEKQDKELKNLIKKVTENEGASISGDTREMINRLETEIFSLKEEIDELNEENNELMYELEDYKRKGKYAIQTNDNMVLPNDSKVNGSIKCEDVFEIKNSAVVYGSIEAVGDIIIGDDVTIEGSLISNAGGVSIGSDTEIQGIIKGTKVEIGENSRAGSIESSGDVTLKENVNVSDVTAIGNVTLSTGVEIDGRLEYAGDLNGAKGVTIKESVLPLSREEVEKDLGEEKELTMEDTEWIDDEMDSVDEHEENIEEEMLDDE